MVRIIGPSEDEKRWIEKEWRYLLSAGERYLGTRLLNTAREALELLRRTVTEIESNSRRPQNEPITVDVIMSLTYDTPVWWAFIGDDRAFVECADVLTATIVHLGAGDRVFFLYKPTSDELKNAKKEEAP